MRKTCTYCYAEGDDFAFVNLTGRMNEYYCQKCHGLFLRDFKVNQIILGSVVLEAERLLDTNGDVPRLSEALEALRGFEATCAFRACNPENYTKKNAHDGHSLSDSDEYERHALRLRVVMEIRRFRLAKDKRTVDAAKAAGDDIGPRC